MGQNVENYKTIYLEDANLEVTVGPSGVTFERSFSSIRGLTPKDSKKLRKALTDVSFQRSISLEKAITFMLENVGVAVRHYCWNEERLIYSPDHTEANCLGFVLFTRRGYEKPPIHLVHEEDGFIIDKKFKISEEIQ